MMTTAVSGQVSRQVSGQVSSQASTAGDGDREMAPSRSGTGQPPASQAAAAWKRLSVGQFLQSINWSNRPEAAIAPAQSSTSSTAQAQPAVAVEALSYRLSVGQFFGAIPWDGKAPVSATADSALSSSDPSPADQLPPTTEPVALELPDLDEFADGAADTAEDLTLDDFFDAFSEG